MLAPKTLSHQVRTAIVVASTVGLAFALGAGCSSSDNNTEAADAAAPSDASGRDRSAQDPDVGSQCIQCSMIAGILVDGTGFGGGGGPPGGGGDGAALDPCSDAGAQGGPGGGTMTFCKQDVFDAFTQCLQTKCSGPCNFTGIPGGGGGGAQCISDAGPEASLSDAASDPDGSSDDGGDAALEDAAADGGGDCKACVVAHCDNEYVACEADK